MNGFGSGAMPAMLHAQSSPPNVRPRTRPSPRPTRRRRHRPRTQPPRRRSRRRRRCAAASFTSATDDLRTARRRAGARWPAPIPLPPPVTSATVTTPTLAPADTVRNERRDRSRRSGSHVASATVASAISSTGSHHSGGRSITAVAPSVATARSGASAFTAIPVPCSSVANETVKPIERGLARRVGGRARLLRAVEVIGVDDRARDVDDPARAALAHGRARPPSSAGTGVMTLTSYATRSRRSDVSSMLR